MKGTKTTNLLALVLALAMALTLCACGSKPQEEQRPETVEFTDSLGRTVTVPGNIEKVAVSGPLAQIVLFALCPDELVGVASKWSAAAEQYIDSKYYDLPELGQLYGGKGELNLETLLASGAQVVIDVGEPKATAKEDLDALQEQTGIPFVHITGTTQTMGDAYTKLGELLNKKDEAKVLADYCTSTYQKMEELAGKVQKVNALYCLGDQGLNVIAKGSFHAEIIDLMINNVAQVDDPSSKGTGNEVDIEQILKWDPDVIVFAPDSIYDTVADDAVWQQVSAIRTGQYYKVPFGPYNWMGFPPSVQRYLGLMWMAKVLYPEQADLDLQTEVTNYFKLFYHCDLTAEQYHELVGTSLDAVNYAA